MFGEAWPSQRKLASLRKQGIIPFSPFARRLIVLIFCLSFFYGQIDNINALLSYRYLEPGSEVDLLIVVRDVSRAFAYLLIGFSIGLVCIVFMLGLLETKFSITFAKLHFDLTKLFSFSFQRGLRGLVQYFIAFFLIAVMCLMIVYWQLEKLLVLFNQSSEVIFGFLSKQKEFPLFLVTILSLFALIAFGFARLAFYFRHRMSRDEIIQEARQ